MSVSIYYCATGPVAGNVGAQNLVSVENPAASPRTVGVLRADANGVLTVASLVAAVYRLGRTTAIPTGGNTPAIAKQDSSAPAASAIVRTAPTATLADLIWANSPGVILALGAGAFPVTMAPAGGWDGRYLAVLMPGEGLLLAVDANLATWTHYANLAWIEF